jgi:multidrug efflux system outer membrane protein
MQESSGMANNTHKNTILSVSMAVILSTMTGCANLAPDYQQPIAPIEQHYDVPEHYQSVVPLASKGNLFDDLFSDERLRDIITLALENNRDLRQATIRIVKARALYGVENAATLPNLNAQGSADVSHTADSLRLPGQPSIIRQYSVSLATSSYEFDFFGRVKNLKEQALQDFYATEQARNTVKLSLIAQVANAWFNWSADHDLLAVAQSLLESQTETLSIIQQRFDINDVTALELHQQQAAVASAQVAVEQLIGQNAKDKNALSLLLGTSVPKALSPSGFGKAIANNNTDSLTAIPVGLPSDLMLRRPDILANEHKLIAANANIGVARAAFYPSISLTANAGFSSTALNNLFDSGSGAWMFAPQITLPIFDAGANKAKLKVATAERDIAISEYEKTIQIAFKEVSDALVDRASIIKQLEAQRDLVVANDLSFKLTQARYQQGIDNWLDVLNAERNSIEAQNDLIKLYSQSLTNRITLFKVLGGSWQGAKQSS